jgi:hypothetical protein
VQSYAGREGYEERETMTGGKLTGLAAGFVARERWKVSRKEADAGDAAFDGLVPAVKDDGLAGLNHDIRDWCGEDVSVGSKDGRFVLEQVVQVAFELLDVACVLLVLLGAVAFAVAEQPERVALSEEWT